MPALANLSVAAQLPVTLVSGAGAELFDETGRAYWDFYGGHAVALLGQGHPGWVEALHRQAQRLSFVTTVAPTPIRTQAIDALCAFTEMSHAFLVNSGAEANEAALKITRKQTGRDVIVAMQGGFHGRTMACLGVTHAGHYRVDHAPVHGAARFVPFGDLSALEAAMDADVAGVIVEPIQGVAGVIEAPPGFLSACREICDRWGACLILDEVQTGMGRTGLPMAWHREPTCRPDLVTVGKSLGAGFPVAALLTTERMSQSVAPGEHGSTFGGAPMACAAVLAVLGAIRDEALLAAAQDIGARLKRLQNPGIRAVRGHGCLIGLVLDRPARPVVSALLDHAVVAGSAADPACLRLCPPALMPDAGLDALEAALTAVLI